MTTGQIIEKSMPPATGGGDELHGVDAALNVKEKPARSTSSMSEVDPTAAPTAATSSPPAAGKRAINEEKELVRAGQGIQVRKVVKRPESSMRPLIRFGCALLVFVGADAARLDRPIAVTDGPEARASPAGARTTTLGMWHTTLSVHNLTLSGDFYRAFFTEIPRPRLPVRGIWFSTCCPFEGGCPQCLGALHLIIAPTQPIATGPVHGPHVSLTMSHRATLASVRGVLARLGRQSTISTTRSDSIERLFFTDPDGHGWELLWPHSSGLAPSVPLLGSPRIPWDADAQVATHTGTDGAVSCGNPLAAAAAIAVLRAGGTAAEAAIAGAAVLGVVEPFNGGLGGDLFAIIGNAVDTHLFPVKVLNAAGRAPKGLPPINELKSRLAREDQRTVGEKIQNPIPKRGPLSLLSVPGAAAGWCALYLEEGGQRPWSSLFAPAIDLALNGFQVSNRTAAAWAQGTKEVLDFAGMPNAAKDAFRAHMFGSAPPTAGTQLANSELAASYDALARGGCTGFYGANGPMQLALGDARKMGAELKPESTGLKDALPTWETPLKANISVPTRRHPSGARAQHTVYTPGTSSQGSATLAILMVLSELEVDPARDRAAYMHGLISAKRLVYQWEAGRDARDIEKMDRETVQAIAKKIKSAAALRRSVGQTGRDVAATQPITGSSGDTEGIAVTDSAGRVVALSQSIGNLFGSGLCSPRAGFCLHGRGYGFTLDGKGRAGHMLEHGARPFHTLAPIIVTGAFTTDDGGIGSVGTLGIATKGGDRVPYAASNFLWTLLSVEEGNVSRIAEALKAPRLRDHGKVGKAQPSMQSSAERRAYTERDFVEFEGLEAPCNSSYCPEISHAYGYTFIPPKTPYFEDSGFGVLHAVLVVPDRASGKLRHFAATDTSRKPGASDVAGHTHDGDNDDDSVLQRALQEQASSHCTSSTVDLGEGGPVNKVTHRGVKVLTHSHMWYPDRYKMDETLCANQSLVEPATARWPHEVELRVLPCLRISLQSAKKQPFKIYSYAKSELGSVEKPDAYYLVDRRTQLLPLQYPKDLRLHPEHLAFPMGRWPQIDASRFFTSLNEDKARWIQFLRNRGLGSHLPVTLEAVDLVAHCAKPCDPPSLQRTLNTHGLSLPVIVKRGAKNGATNAIVAVHDSRQLHALVSKPIDMVVQELLPGKREYSLNFASMGGRVLTTLIYEFSYARDFFHHRGLSKKRLPRDGRLMKRVVPLASLHRHAHEFLHTFVKRVQYNGIGCLQFKLVDDVDGEARQNASTVKLIEFNPRACGSLANGQQDYFNSRLGLQKHYLGYFVRRWLNEHKCWHAKASSIFELAS